MAVFLQYCRFRGQLQQLIDKNGKEHLPNVDYSRSTSEESTDDEQREPKQEEDLEKGNKEILIVQFAGDDDPDSPLNWSYGRKWFYTAIVGSTGFLVSGASAFDSEVAPQAMEQFGVGQEVALLATTLFMVALGLGGLISAPFSETVGRQTVYLICLSVFALFEIGAAVSPNIQSWLVCRFFAGFFGSVPLTTFGGSVSDMWNPVQRTYVFPVMCCLTFIGPFLAPMVADFIGTSPLVSWQWTEWITVILAGTVVLCFALFVPETYAPILLTWKAKHIRSITKDDRFRAEHELEQANLVSSLLHSVWRPIEFLLKEPIVDLFALYLVIVYIILFGFLPGFDFIYGEDGIYGKSQKLTGLTYLPMNVGFLVALLPIIPIYQRFKRKAREAREAGKDKVDPEERLVFAMLGAPLLPISIFWMGWTAWRSVSPWASYVASAVFGFAVQAIFISTYAYIIDSYEQYAASALVGLTVTRYCASGPMVIVSVPMYTNLGVHWTLTLLGCLALVMTPVPYIFYRFGPKIRKHSRSAS